MALSDNDTVNIGAEQNGEGEWITVKNFKDKYGFAPNKTNYGLSEVKKVSEQKKSASHPVDPYEQRYGTLPEDIQFQSVLDNNGNLMDQYQLQSQGLADEYSKILSGINVNQDALKQMRARAKAGVGESRWGTEALKRQALEEATMRDQASQMGMSGLDQAQASLAMRGGLGSGAGERMASSSARDIALGRQNVGRQGAMSRQNILTSEEEQRMNLLPQLAGQETNLAQFGLGKAAQLQGAKQSDRASSMQADMFNKQAALQDIAAKRGFDLNKWTQGMKSYAALQGSKDQVKIAEEGK